MPATLPSQQSPGKDQPHHWMQSRTANAPRNDDSGSGGKSECWWYNVNVAPLRGMLQWSGKKEKKAKAD